MHPLFDLTGRVALITGSTKGIGRAIAERMAECGARVVISSRRAAATDQVAAELCAKGHSAIGISCNINEKQQLQSLVDGTRRAFGQIDVLVCNAAVNPYYGPSQSIDDAAFDKILNANIRSNHWLCQMVIPEMAERRSGSVIVISSIGGLKGSESLGAYGISKAADMQLVRNLAVEWGRQGVRVNAIAPGLVRTDFARALWENPTVYETAVQRYPLGRIGEPDEVAGVAVLLASKSGSFITGQTIVIDGGATIAS
jgi:NAD(P)-dependent dehydrogenase (short-subunit alcohol dehydrogenase family)